MKKGIDISYHNGRPDFEKAKRNGVEFAILRAGYGLNTVDTQFNRSASECNRLGIPIGIYWFCYSYTTEQARKEARKCIETIKKYKIDLPVYHDLEYDSLNYARRCGHPLNKAMITAMTKAFCEEIEKAGYKAGFYFNLDFMNNYYNMNALKGYSTWYARYISTRFTQYDIQQYSSKGFVPGIAGSVDMNYLYNDNILTKSKKKPKKGDTSKSVMELAVEVLSNQINGDDRKKYLGNRYSEVQDYINSIYARSIDAVAVDTKSGKYGNGDTRKILLGDKYSAVQKAVNKMYKK